MNPQNVMDAVVWVASAGTICGVAVQLMKMFAGVDSPRAKVGTAVVMAFILTAAYGLSNGLLTVANLYMLIVATITIAAAGAGIQSAMTATITGQPQGPTPALPPGPPIP